MQATNIRQKRATLMIGATEPPAEINDARAMRIALRHVQHYGYQRERRLFASKERTVALSNCMTRDDLPRCVPYSIEDRSIFVTAYPARRFGPTAEIAAKTYATSRERAHISQGRFG
jgi:hypothetical protein